MSDVKVVEHLFKLVPTKAIYIGEHCGHLVLYQEASGFCLSRNRHSEPDFDDIRTCFRLHDLLGLLLSFLQVLLHAFEVFLSVKRQLLSFHIHFN